MKHKTKISVAILAFGLLFPMIAIYAEAMDETWGVTVGSDYYYTFGVDGSVDLPTALWEVLSEEFAMGLNDSYENAYEVGYADTYWDGYSDGYDTPGTYDGDFTNPYAGYGSTYGWDSYESGLEDGFNNGHYDGYWGQENTDDYGEYVDDWFERYVNQTVFNGFSQANVDAVDLETIYTAFLAMNLVFNMRIHIDSMSTLTISESGENYYYDVINMTIQFKRATDSTYQVFEVFVEDFIDTEIRAFITAGFAGTGDILANITADINEAVADIHDHIINDELVMENRGMVWGSGQTTDVVANELADGLLLEVLGDFGFNFEQERSYYYGWGQAYEQGYEDGYYGDAHDDQYEGDWPWGYEHGLEQGYNEGYYDGQYDNLYSEYHGYYYDNYYI